MQYMYSKHRSRVAYISRQIKNKYGIFFMIQLKWSTIKANLKQWGVYYKSSVVN